MFVWTAFHGKATVAVSASFHYEILTNTFYILFYTSFVIVK